MPLSRPEKISAIMGWLGSLATERDAERILDALEAKGHQIVHEPGVGPVLTPPFTEGVWIDFVNQVLSEGGKSR